MTIIVFDWDDTLMATTHVQPYVQRNSVPVLPQLAKSIMSLIELARQHGEIRIITNAGTGWLKFCIDKMLPGCEDFTRTIPIHSSRDTSISNNWPYHLWKTVSFLENLKHLSAEKDSQILCFGDCHFDALASQNLHKNFSNLTVKNIKLLDSPSLQQVLDQHEMIRKFLLSFLQYPKSASLTFNYKKSSESMIQNSSSISTATSDSSSVAN